MDYRVLPRTELKVSRLSMGTMTFGSQVSEADSIRMVDRGLEAGINFFDTANIYNGGESERIVGNALKGRRDKVILTSKVRGKMGDGPDEVGLSGRAMRKAIEASLKRLRTDYLDLYYLHQPDYDVGIEETLETMAELVREGKVRFPATSNYAAWQVTQILWISEKKGYPAPTISQPMYNLLARAIEEEYLPFCKEHQIAVIPYNPLAGGFLTGKHKEGGGSSHLRHALRRQQDVSRPLLALRLFPGRGRGGGDCQRGRPDARGAGLSVAAQPADCGLGDSGRIPNGAAGCQPEGLRREAFGRGHARPLHRSLEAFARRHPEIQPLIFSSSPGEQRGIHLGGTSVKRFPQSARLLRKARLIEVMLHVAV